ncbi:MAG: hypothetical protein QG635_2134, partial [Bacteroidota bacterium]|nr:hypothetical protein [Bacteroidota bacterium]
MILAGIFISPAPAQEFMLADGGANLTRIFKSEAGLNDIKPKIALALSGGGARGIAQIGVLEEFEKAGIEIDYIVGTSIGAMLGGLYASGYTAAELDSIMLHADWDEIISFGSEINRGSLYMDQKLQNDRSLITLHFKNFEFIAPQGISGGTRLNAFMQRLVWDGIYHSDSDFDNLKYPFRAIATDLVTGKTVSLKSGNLASAMLASAAVPLRFTPVRKDSMVLVDGGLMANIPSELTAEFKPDIIIAVNTTSPLLGFGELDTPWSLADQVVSISMDYFSRFSKTKADVLIQPEIGSHSNVDFSGLDSLIEAGRSAGREALNKIRELVELKADSIFKNKILNNILPGYAPDKSLSIELAGFNHEDSLLFDNYFETLDNKQHLPKDLKQLQKLFELDNYKNFKFEIIRNNENQTLRISAKKYPL